MGFCVLGMFMVFGAKAAFSTVGRLLCVLALGMTLAGCDRCGDWFWTSSQVEACKGKLPPQQ
jgi:hypothetical protein